MPKNKTILVAPLNWGLGHATRSIPIISALLKEGYNVVIASDGEALQLLRNTFPELAFVQLPSYKIQYTKNGRWLSLKLLWQLPRMIRAIYAEHRQLKKWCRIHPIDGIISDNRPGIFQPLIPSVYITHQLKVLSGWTTQISSFLHRKLIHRFDECWVPDLASEIKISGELGNANHYRIPVRYIGVLSRMIPQRLPIDHEVVCVLSGPEPQRSILEEQLITTFLDHDKSVLLIQGLVSSPKDIRTLGAITIVPFLNSRELEMSLNKSNWVICRSGYTSIMDLLVLRKKVFFIPTPGQNEQEYLAKRMEQLEFAPFCKQSEFSIEQLLRIEQFKGMKLEVEEPHFEKLFDLFDRK